MPIVSTGSASGSITQGRNPGTTQGFCQSLERMFAGGSRGGPSNNGALISVDKVTGIGTVLSGQIVTDAGLTGMSFSPSGRLYCSTIFGLGTNSTLIAIDPRDGTIIVDHGEFSKLPELLGISVNDMTIDPATGEIYLAGFDRVDENSAVYRLDLGTMQATFITFVPLSDLGGPGGGGPISFRDDGVLFVGHLDNDTSVSTLFEMDKTTGAFSNPFVLSRFYDGANFDRQGNLYLTVGGSGDIWVLSSGVETFVGDVGIGRVSSLAFDQFTFDSGAMLGVLSTASKKSFDGDVVQIIRDPSLVPVDSNNAIGATSYGFQILLDTVDVTESIIGDVSILIEIDRLTSAEFTLHGKPFSFVVTEQTWTRTRVDIFFIQGLFSEQTERLQFSGYVHKGTPEGDFSYRVTALDLGLVSSRNKVCLELAPDTGLTRDQILDDVLTTAGFAGTDFPGMKLYDKPFNFTGEVWGEAVEFAEPEGLHVRVNNAGIVEGYSITLKSTPDHIWDVAEMLKMPAVTPPDSVESTWVFRGDVTSESTGTETQGVEIELRSTNVFGIFNNQTIRRQQTDGQIVDRNFQLGSPHSSFTKFQLIKIVETEIHRLAGDIILKIDRELSFKNPKSARYETVAGQTGPGPQGTNFVACFITEDEEFVVWSSAKFVITLERRETFNYDSQGTDIGSIIESFEYYQRTEAVQTDTGSHVVGTYVGSDNMSYDRNGPSLYQIEGYGLKSRFELERIYDNNTGAQVDEIQTTFGWYSVRAEVDNNYVLFNGEGQQDFTALFQKIETITKPFVIDSSGRKVGEIKATSEYFVQESSVGTFNWGQFSAESESETFRTTEIDATAFDALSSSVFTKTKYTGEGLRDSETFPGKPPVPRYTASSFTRYISVPSEVIVIDSLIEGWFGRKSKVVTIKHALTVDELKDILTRRRSRELSFHIMVVRLQTLGELGDTVLVADFNQGIFHAGVIISIRHTRGYANSVSEYVIEFPLFKTGLTI